MTIEHFEKMVRRYILSNLLAGQDSGQFTDGANRCTKDTIYKVPVTSEAAGELLQLGERCHHPHQTGNQTWAYLLGSRTFFLTLPKGSRPVPVAVLVLMLVLLSVLVSV